MTLPAIPSLPHWLYSSDPHSAHLPSEVAITQRTAVRYLLSNPKELDLHEVGYTVWFGVARDRASPYPHIRLSIPYTMWNIATAQSVHALVRFAVSAGIEADYGSVLLNTKAVISNLSAVSQ